MSSHNPTHGQKVHDSNASEIREGAGAVASDSLAADSSRAGGGFSENRNSEPSGVAGANSTFANTNTSGATRLDPASDAEARMAEDDWAEEKKLGANSTSYPDAAGGQSKGLSVSDTRGSYETSGKESSAGTAPSYVNSQGGGGGPKGKNLTEGGFESDDRKNASWNQSIGGKNDPGRLGEEKFQRENADTGGGAGMPKQAGVSDDNSFGTLGGDTSA